MLKKLFLIIIALQLTSFSVAYAVGGPGGPIVAPGDGGPGGVVAPPPAAPAVPAAGIYTDIDTLAQDFFAFKSLDKFIYNLFQIALVLGAIAAFLFLIWGAIDYTISGGNQERVKTSKTMIGNALAGLAILAASWVIWRLVAYFLGLSPSLRGPFNISLPTP